MSEPDGFLSRWARRKAQVQTGVVSPEPAEPLSRPMEAPVSPAASEPSTLAAAIATTPEPSAGVQPAPVAEPPPTLHDVALLTRESDYSRFVEPGVDGTVRNAAMKKLFTDPHFNVMDGLDTYIDDYGKPDPIPESMLRMMRQSKFLGLFDDEAQETAQPPHPAVDAAAVNEAASPDALLKQTATREEAEDLSHEDTDLRLQQDDAAGRPGPGQGPGA